MQVPYNVSTYVMQPNWHQMKNRPRVIISKPKNSSPILKIEEIKETNQDKDQESDTEPDSDVDDQQKRKDQEGGSFGNDNGITLDVEYPNGDTSGQDNGTEQDVEYQNGETSGQDNGINTQQIVVVLDDENENRNGLINRMVKTGLIMKNVSEKDKDYMK